MEKKWTETEKKQLKIFALVAFGLPVLMGVLMGIGFYRGGDIGSFPAAQMFYPAAGVMLALMLTKDKDTVLPKKFYIGFLLTTAVMIITSVISLFYPDVNWTLMSQYPMMLMTIVCWILLFCDPKAVKAKYKLTFSGKKKAHSWLYILLFLVLYIGRLLITCVIAQDMASFTEVFANPFTYVAIASLAISFLLAFTAFFGEEYGWRYFFQPLLQKRFGLKGGVLVLGVLWGFWHLPINIFYYSPDTWVISVILQLITCISLAIFFGYGYMKTENAWVPVAMHFLNNNMIAVVTGSVDINNQVYRWIDIPVMIAANIVFILFIFSKVYKEKKEAVVQEA